MRVMKYLFLGRPRLVCVGWPERTVFLAGDIEKEWNWEFNVLQSSVEELAEPQVFEVLWICPPLGEIWGQTPNYRLMPGRH